LLLVLGSVGGNGNDCLDKIAGGSLNYPVALWAEAREECWDYVLEVKPL
jgi:hypothetical protein